LVCYNNRKINLLGCGLKTAKDNLNSYSRVSAQPIIILITDGENNAGQGATSLNNAIAYANSTVPINGKIPLIFCVGRT
jgi:hypothetical protein